MGIRREIQVWAISSLDLVGIHTPYSKVAASLLFCLHSNWLSLPRQHVQNAKNFEVKMKRLINWLPFWNKVYCIQAIHCNGGLLHTQLNKGIEATNARLGCYFIRSTGKILILGQILLWNSYWM